MVFVDLFMLSVTHLGRPAVHANILCSKISTTIHSLPYEKADTIQYIVWLYTIPPCYGQQTQHIGMHCIYCTYTHWQVILHLLWPPQYPMTHWDPCWDTSFENHCNNKESLVWYKCTHHQTYRVRQTTCQHLPAWAFLSIAWVT